tara:strand:- start:4292 stop:4846 length:555 start_codon:yes stop_codon:yes gene_type:complete
MKFNISNDYLVLGVFFLMMIFILDKQNNVDIKDTVQKHKKVRKLKIIRDLNNQGLIEQRYRDRVNDKFVEPERDYVNTRGLPVNIRTRGAEPAFQSIGFLYRDESSANYNVDDENRFMLFGRPEWSGSSQFDYYVTSSGGSSIKIPLSNEKELYDGDEVAIVGFTGNFKVELYDVSQIKYIPFL